MGIAYELPNLATGRLFRLDPPIHERNWLEDDEHCYHEFVVVFASDTWNGPDTSIYPAEADGEITHWRQLPGSAPGSKSVEDALFRAGYEIAKGSVLR